MKRFIFVFTLLAFAFLFQNITGSNVYAADCTVNVDPITNISIPVVTIKGGTSGCLKGNGVERVINCDASGQLTSPTEDCIKGYSDIRHCEVVNNAATCVVGFPTSTPTPIPTNTPPPGSTPTPTLGVTGIPCIDPGDSFHLLVGKTGAKYNKGDTFCYQLNLYDHEEYECKEGGKAERIALCDSCSQTAYAPGSVATCEGISPTPSPTPVDPRCQVNGEVGQLFPQVGTSCGIPESDPVPVKTTLGTSVTIEYKVDATSPVHACCYSTLANWTAPPLSCVLSLPGSWDDGFVDWIGSNTETFIKRLPFFFLPEEENIGIGRLQEMLSDAPSCVIGAKPKDGQKAGDAGCTCVRANNATESTMTKLCENLSDDERVKCEDCVSIKTKQVNVTAALGETTTKTVVESQGVWTSLGCINVQSKNGFIQSLFRLGISLGGAFSLLCNIYGAFLYQMSQGKPESIKKARDLITSCITGLILIIFSIFILRIIGYNILQIPGFSAN